LRDAVAAVFDSWQSARAKAYRRHCGIPDSLGTAVTVQAMAFGNLDDRSGTGVLFTRDPLTGGPEPYGEYLPRGQGEDVVAGERTPLPLSSLAGQLPEVHAELLRAGRLLEAEGADVQDVEFTVERGRLYLLQSRRAKRSPRAAVRLAVELVDDGVIGVADALTRVTADQVRAVLRPRLADGHRAAARVLATGEPACPGVAAGPAVTDGDEVVERAERGEQVVFVATTTSPEDIQAMIAAVAVVTGIGGSTSHAAVVCRGLGKPAVVGCGNEVVTSLPGRAVLSAEAPAQVVDLDALGVVDAGGVVDAVGAAEAATGSVLDTDAGIAAAVRCGLKVVVTGQPLPALLAAYAANAHAGTVAA
jgi:pyruvate,orthophosphate dikinase